MAIRDSVDDLNFPDELVRAAERGLAAMGDYQKRDVAQDSCDDSTPSIDILARSNHRLREQQTENFKKKIAEKNKELLRLDYEILRLQLELNKGASAIRSLVKTRLEMQKEVDANHVWISSARLLPVDVIILIIEYAIARGPYRYSSPKELSQVCSSWRKAALTCTSLWNELEIYSMPFDCYRVNKVHRYPSVKSHINTWFSRSTPTASLSFYINLIFDEVDSHFGKSLTEGILPFADRVSKIEITFNGSHARDVWESRGLELLAPFLTLPPGTFPRLNELKFLDYVSRQFLHRPAEEIIPKITVFDQSPLRHFTLRPQYWLKVDAHPMDTVVVPVGEPITFSSLTDWKLNICTYPQREIMEDVLSKIRLPGVETLALVADTLDRTSALPFDALFPFLSDIDFVYPPLRRLVLSHWDIAPIQLMDLLISCSLLEELSLYLPSIEPQLIMETLSIRSLTHLVSFAFAFTAPGRGQIEPIEENEELKVVLTPVTGPVIYHISTI
ncbi:hypothetical protein H0H93_003922, partial [Arthromyces matolae]